MIGSGGWVKVYFLSPWVEARRLVEVAEDCEVLFIVHLAGPRRFSLAQGFKLAA